MSWRHDPTWSDESRKALADEEREENERERSDEHEDD
jgi:hypothetical protein